jgi:hypothetical protein
MTDNELQSEHAPALEELPVGKIKAWMPPRTPDVITIENNNQGRNPAHRGGSFQVKLAGAESWEEVKELAWGESHTYDSYGGAFVVRNKGTIALNVAYQWPAGVRG